MHSFLGSQGLGAFPDWLDELPHRPQRALLVPTAGNRLAATPWVEVADSCLRAAGLHIDRFDIEGATEDEVAAQLHGTDLVFVTGGNQIFLLEHAQRSGFAPAVRDAVRGGRLAYAGVSAGAIVTAPDLALYRDDDDPSVVTDTTGLGLVPFFPLVHANRGRAERYARLAEEHRHREFVRVDDDQAIVVTGTSWTLRPSPSTDL